jgi:gas vesicle protein
MSEEIDVEVVREAESQGWVPKEKFVSRGHSEAEWVDADVFVKRGREILPILRKNNENLMKDLNATKEQLKELREAAEDFKKFQKESYQRKVEEYEARITQLKESRAQAITDGDGQKVNALDEAIDTVKDEAKQAKQAVKAAETPVKDTELPASKVEPELQVWLDKNPWFGTDKRLTGMANGVGESLRFEFPNLKGKEFLDKLDEVLEEEFPGRFKGEPKKKAESKVESGSGRQSRASSSAHVYENLPADARAACDRYIKQGLIKTREQYLADYAWE